MNKVAMIGAGVTKFGVRKASYRDLIWEAGSRKSARSSRRSG